MTSNIGKRLTNLACLCAMFLALTIVGATADAATSAGDTALFDRLDKNHSGEIEADEITPENQPLFDRLLRRGDTNHDSVLSRKEFLDALIPSRPEKPLEAKEPTNLPGANAVRYLLLTMDANRNTRLEKSEVPSKLEPAFDMMVGRLDRNNDGVIERQELNRGGPAMSAVANRYVQRLGIDVDRELAKLKKSEGSAFDRFEQKPVPLTEVRNPKQARQLFAQFDENADGKLDPKELPNGLQVPIKRLVRIGDLDDDGKLSEKEFVAATEQIAQILKRRQKAEKPLRKGKSARKPKPATTAISDKK